MTFADFVVANSGKPLTEDQRRVFDKYEQRKLGDKKTKLSILPGGKAEDALKEWWDKYLKSRETLFEEVRESKDGECYACGSLELHQPCEKCGHMHCVDCLGACHVCGSEYCEDCANEHGCEEYL